MGDVHQVLQVSDRAVQQELASGDQSRGAVELTAKRELTADQARAVMEQAFARLPQRRLNESLIRKAEAAGTVVVRHV